MKVELQCGDTITIPGGCKAIVKDGCIVFEREIEFKDGDVLVSITTCGRSPFIFRKREDNGDCVGYVGLDNTHEVVGNGQDKILFCGRNISYATIEERQILFDKMKEQGLRWDVEEKQVKKIRWRAKKDEDYHSVGTNLAITITSELGDQIDTNRYNALNYFRTKEQAKEAAKRIKEVLRKFHEEIGE